MLFRLSLIMSLSAAIVPCWGSMEYDTASVDKMISGTELSIDTVKNLSTQVEGIAKQQNKNTLSIGFLGANRTTFGRDFLNYLQNEKNIAPIPQVTKLVFISVGMREVAPQLWDLFPNVKEVVLWGKEITFPWFLADLKKEIQIPTQLTINMSNIPVKNFKIPLNSDWLSHYPACYVNKNDDNLLMQFLNQERQINVYKDPQLKPLALGASNTVNFVLKEANWESLEGEMKKTYNPKGYPQGEKQYILSKLPEDEAKAALAPIKASNKLNPPTGMGWRGKGVMTLVGAAAVSAVVIGTIAWYRKKSALASKLSSKEKLQATAKPVTA